MKKVTLKDYGFWEWFNYHSENDTWTYFFIRLFISCLTAFITAIIVTNNVISSNKCGDVSDQQRANNIQENNSDSIE